MCLVRNALCVQMRSQGGCCWHKGGRRVPFLRDPNHLYHHHHHGLEDERLQFSNTLDRAAYLIPYYETAYWRIQGQTSGMATASQRAG